MDFTKFDNRGPAENGSRCYLRDPMTGDPIGNNDDAAPYALVRGVASRSAQNRLREMQRKNKGKGKDLADKVPEDAHKDLIDTAIPYIAGLFNVEIGGEEVGSDEAKIRQVLDLTFPHIEQREDENGEMKGELVNHPFAKQIIDHAGENSHFLGGT